MSRLLLVANPAASGFTGALHREVVAVLSQSFEVEAVWPAGADDARHLAAKAAADGFGMAVAMGGDGVVHHVANGLVDSETALGIIPAGTTNVLARIMRMPLKPAAAARYLAGTPTVGWVPLGRMRIARNGASRTEYATFAAGIGYDAEVVERAERRPHGKTHFGGIHFASTAAGLFLSEFRTRLPSLRVEAGGERADGTAVMVQIHWPYTYFGRMPLKVTPRPTDGLEVLVLEDLALLRTPSLVMRSVLGRRLDKLPGVKVWDGVESVTVAAEPPGLLQADGELLGRVEQLAVERAAESLLVAAPRPLP